MTEQTWNTYEEVAAYLLNKFAEHFGVERFEGKQKVQGKGNQSWEIDAVGRKSGTEKFILVECRRYDPEKNSRIKQEHAAAIAYRVSRGTDAMGGIVVVPAQSVIQAGAKEVLDSEGIHRVTLDLQSTTTEYFMEFLNHIAFGIQDKIQVTDHVSIEIVEDDGTLEQRLIEQWQKEKKATQ